MSRIETTPRADARIPPTAQLLGWAGVLPFAALAAAPEAVPVIDGEAALLGYGAIILGFMGGVQWGLEMSRPADAPSEPVSGYAASVVPALVAFAASLVGGLAGLGLLLAGFLGLLGYDRARLGRGVGPAWYGALRLRLTAAVALSLLLAIALRL